MPLPPPPDKKRGMIEQELAGDASPWGKATRGIASTLNGALTNLFNIQAQNRFTKVPIDMQPSDPKLLGHYNPLTNRINVYTDNPDPFSRNLQRTMTHEGIHSLLGNSGFIPYVTNRPSTPEAKQLNDKVLAMFSQVGIPVPAGEAPAFFGTGDLGFTPDLTYPEAEQWLKNFASGLSPETKKMFDRMRANYQKSSRATGWPPEIVKPGP